MTPEKIIYEGEALTVSVPGLMFPFKILDHHASIIALLKEGNIKIQSINHYIVFQIKNGLLKAKNKTVKIIIN